tara:strand:+ start:71 stop:652 length:582 start_codon:yes stop_codon:yes gene_type:complete
MSTLKVDTILKRTGTGTITVGQSGDTISIPSGATLNSAGTNTLEGIANTPAFFVALTTNVTISDNTITKIPFATEVFDTDSAYDSSTNYRFTVPSGKAGKYYFTFQGAMGILKDYKITIYLKKNGSYVGTEAIFTNGYQPSADDNIRSHYTTLLDLAVSDYIEMWVKINNNGTSSAFLHGDNFTTFFTGYKLV